MGSYQPQAGPPILHELENVVGMAAAIKLVEAYPGIPLYVPFQSHAGHRIAVLLGLELMAALVDRYGGTFINMPNCHLRTLKYRIATDDQYSVREAALKTGFTTRYIHMLRSSGSKKDTPQEDLFGDG